MVDGGCYLPPIGDIVQAASPIEAARSQGQ